MPAETYELVISGTLAGQFVQTIFHVAVDNSTSRSPFVVAEDLMNTLNGAPDFMLAWCNCLPASYLVSSLRSRRIGPTGGPTAIMLGAALSATTGARTGSISAAQVNPVVIWITTPRENKPGRTFLPGVSESDIDAMVYSAGLITVIDALILIVVTPFVLTAVSDDCEFSIWRRSISNRDEITHGRLSPVVGTQRRRLHPV